MRRRRSQTLQITDRIIDRSHPSGRPIRYDEYRSLPISRPPAPMPLTPGLRAGRERVEAIGFTADWGEDDADQ